MCVWGAILIMCCCGLGSSSLSLSLSFSPCLFLFPSLSLSLSLCSTWSRQRPSSSLFPLSAVPVTTLLAVNRRGDGQRGIKRRRESNSNWLRTGHVIFTPLRLSVSYLPSLFFSFLFPHRSPFPLSCFPLSFHAISSSPLRSPLPFTVPPPTSFPLFFYPFTPL